MTVIISRHVPGEGPGYLAEFLERERIPYRIVKIDAGESLPERIDGISGLVFMGGPMSVNDPLPWIPRALDLIRASIDRDLPVLGHCLGGQLISKALGGTVRRQSAREIGWFPVTVSANPVALDWTDPLGASFEAFHWHGETFTVPDGATHILASEACANQAFVIGRSLALQCHVEMTRAMVGRWTREGAHELSDTGRSVQTPAQLLEQLEARIERLHRVADRLYGRWLKGFV
ncbi:MAG: type 1 glutamine amidotransferase [Acidiferrobacteraceae bacterium]